MSPARVLGADRDISKWLIAFLSIVGLAMLVLLGYPIWSAYQQDLRDAETTTRDYAAIIKARLDATLRRADASLWELAKEIPAAALSQQAVPRYAGELNADLERQTRNFKEVGDFLVADRYGGVLYTGRKEGRPDVTVSDRSYFRRLRDNPKAGLVFSEVVTDRINGQSNLVMARALTDGSGSFLGVVFAPLELEQFQTLFKSLGIGPQGSIEVFRSDDHRLALRWPHLAHQVNTPLRLEHPLRKRMAAGDKVATLPFAAQSDGVERIYSYQTLADYPFYVVVGLSRDNVLAEWRTRSLAIGATGLSLLGLLAWLLFWLWRARERELRVMAELKQSQQALCDSAQELRLFADNVPAMTGSFDENLCLRFVNKRYADFFGFSQEDIVGKHLREIVGEEVYREVGGHFAQVLRGHPVTYQRTLKHQTGEPRYIEVKLLPHIGDQGRDLGCYAVMTDITEHKLTEARIQRVAHHDSLTGLPNRLLFNDRLNQAISFAKRDSRQFALLYLDLDKFKPVNDTLGHTSGDELLQGVAARIRQQVRESDTVARIGGDEFTVILPDIARRDEAETVAKKIIAALAAPFQLGSLKQCVEIGTSIGIAVYPADARDADALIKAADAAMYRAKQVGDSFRFYAT